MNLKNKFFLIIRTVEVVSESTQHSFGHLLSCHTPHVQFWAWGSVFSVLHWMSYDMKVGGISHLINRFCRVRLNPNFKNFDDLSYYGLLKLSLFGMLLISSLYASFYNIFICFFIQFTNFQTKEAESWKHRINDFALHGGSLTCYPPYWSVFNFAVTTLILGVLIS
jgi:uncharacterized membrane protein